MPIDQKNRPNIPVLFTALFLILFILTFFFPQLFTPVYSSMESSFTAIHLVLEMASVFISFSIGLYGWLSLRHVRNDYPAALPAFFLAVAVFDILHALTFSGMPYFFGAPSVLRSTWFWEFARLTEAVILLALVLSRNRNLKLPQRGTYAASAIYVAIVITLLFTEAVSFPTLLEGTRPNALKITVESVVALVHFFIIGILLYDRYRKGIPVITEFLLASTAIILGSIYFMSYDAMTDFRAFTGHIFKVIGYLAIMRVIFIRNIEEPFNKIKMLHERNRGILNTVDIGMIETDAQGTIRFMNLPAKSLLYAGEEALGQSIFMFNSEGKNVHDFSEMKRADGEVFPAEVERFPLLEHQRVTGYVYTIRELTDAIRQEAIEKEQQQLEFELKTAVTVQNSLLHTTVEQEREHISAISIPYRQLNGDFYAIKVNQNYTLFSAADVSGKGIPAAIQMSMITYAMEQINPAKEEPHEILASLNRFVSRYSNDANFITMFICFFDEKTGRLAYSSGGHEPALLYRAATGEIEELQTKGAGLGFLEFVKYETKYTDLAEGDLVVLYTDGISEDRGRDIDSPDVLKEAIRQADRSKPAKEVATQLLQFVQQEKVEIATDDQTIVVLKKTASQ